MSGTVVPIYIRTFPVIRQLSYWLSMTAEQHEIQLTIQPGVRYI
jgi:hypothetical protein